MTLMYYAYQEITEPSKFQLLKLKGITPILVPTFAYFLYL